MVDDVANVDVSNVSDEVKNALRIIGVNVEDDAIFKSVIGDLELKVSLAIWN